MNPTNIREFIYKWFMLLGYQRMNEDDIQEFLGDVSVIFPEEYYLVKEEIEKVSVHPS